jgi:hypothetical protein
MPVNHQNFGLFGLFAARNPQDAAAQPIDIERLYIGLHISNVFENILHETVNSCFILVAPIIPYNDG